MRRKKLFEVWIDQRYQYMVEATSEYIAGNLALMLHRREMRKKMEIIEDKTATGRLNDPTWCK